MSTDEPETGRFVETEISDVVVLMWLASMLLMVTATIVLMIGASWIANAIRESPSVSYACVDGDKVLVSSTGAIALAAEDYRREKCKP